MTYVDNFALKIDGYVCLLIGSSDWHFIFPFNL